MKALADLATGKISDIHAFGEPPLVDGKVLVDVPDDSDNFVLKDGLVVQKTQEEKDLESALIEQKKSEPVKDVIKSTFFEGFTEKDLAQAGQELEKLLADYPTLKSIIEFFAQKISS